jgi:hemolysin activation/secretion protein
VTEARGDRVAAGLAALWLALAPDGHALAQVRRPGDVPLPPPEFEEPAPAPLPTPTPPAPVVPAPEMPGAPMITVRAFRFVGNTVFTAEQLDEVARAYLRTRTDLQVPLEGIFTACGVDLAVPGAVDPGELAENAANSQTLTISQLLELRRLLTLLYVECGYINSGALLDEEITEAVLDQRGIEGTVTYQIIEGRLSEINVGGTGRLRAGYVRERLKRGAGPPLNMKEFEQRFRILLQDPQIELMNAQLRPGPERGESVLDVEVTPAAPVDLFLVADNHRPPSIGSVEGSAEMTMRNVTGFGDTLGLAFGGGEGGPKADVGYALPLTPQDLTLEIGYEYDSATVVEEPLDELDIDSESWTVGFGLRQPVYRTPSQELVAEARFERRHSKTKLLGRPFSFSPGVDDGESDVSVGRLIVQWTDRSPDQVIAARSTLSYGVDAFGATDNGGDLPDGQYLAWLGQTQLARRWRLEDADVAQDGRASWLRDACGEEWLEWHCRQGVEVILRADTQLADDPLLPIEQFAVGGANTVRGYRENQLVRDNGLVASIEFRLPLYPLSLPFTSADTAMLQLAPFFDYGAAWNHDESEDDIASIGVGLVWDPTPWLSAEVYYGYRLDNVLEPEDNDDLQDYGISFRFAIRASDFLPQGS